MLTTHGSSADRPFGDELSRTVAQFPASAVLAHTSATAAATMSDVRTSDLLCSDAAYTPGCRGGFHRNEQMVCTHVVSELRRKMAVTVRLS
jgi:hypothetical protein